MADFKKKYLETHAIGSDPLSEFISVQYDGSQNQQESMNDYHGLEPNSLDEFDYPFDDFRRQNTQEMIENYLKPKKKEDGKGPQPTKMLSQALL